MTKGFWDNLPQPFFALAPMYDVTDAAFRKIITKYGKPDLFYTEFVSTDGLNSVARQKLIHHLWFEDAQLPIIAQVFGTKPEKFAETAKLVSDLGFSGIDINMGCPDKNIIKGGSCSGLFRTPELAQQLVLACKEAVPDLPVSVKIRIGDTKIDWQDWIKSLLQAEPSAIAIHLRTRKEMSKVPAHWELMPEIVQFIHDNTTKETRPKIIGNGDVETLGEAKEKAKATGCDGVMIGRGIFGNPWLFNKDGHIPSVEEKISALKEHVEAYDEIFLQKNIKPFDVMKRHFKAYINGFDGASELRAELYETKNCEQVTAVLSQFLSNRPS